MSGAPPFPPPALLNKMLIFRRPAAHAFRRPILPRPPLPLWIESLKLEPDRIVFHRPLSIRFRVIYHMYCNIFAHQADDDLLPII